MKSSSYRLTAVADPSSAQLEALEKDFSARESSLVIPLLPDPTSREIRRLRGVVSSLLAELERLEHKVVQGEALLQNAKIREFELRAELCSPWRRTN